MTTPISTAKRNPKDNKFMYSRELLLNLFALDCPVPGDTDHSLGAFVEHPRPPLAHQPLSVTEKRLLSMVSINSETTRRNNTIQKKGRERIERPPVSSLDKIKETSAELWDVPAVKSLGTFGVEGIFDSGSAPPREVRQVVNSNQWSVFETENTNTLSSPTRAQEFTSSFGSRDLGRNDGSPEFNYTQKSRENTLGFNLTPHSEPFNQPPFQFVPPQWLYEDPFQKTQGPFTSQQMHGWYIDGYFPATLPIKCVGDAEFIALSQFVQKYGSTSPFLDSLYDQEVIERKYHSQEIKERQKSRISQPPFQPGVPFGLRQPNDNNSMFYDLNNSNFRSNIAVPVQGIQLSQEYGAQPFKEQAQPDKEAFLQFMQDSNFKEHETIIPEDEDLQGVQEVSPTDVTTPLDQDIQIKKTLTEPAKGPLKLKLKPKTVPEETQFVAKIGKFNGEAVNENVLVEDFEARVDSEVFTEEPKLAPWANTRTSSNPALQSIQKLEQKIKDENAARESKDASLRIIAEAKQIAQQDFLLKTSQASVPQWNKLVPSQVVKKTLSEIIANESANRILKSSQNSSTAGKGYANAALLGSTRTLINPTSKPKANSQTILSSAENISVASDTSSWNVVTKKVPNKSTPVVLNATTGSRSAPVRINYSAPEVSSALNSMGIAPKRIESTTKRLSSEFWQWCRLTLKAVRNSTLNIDDFINVLLSVEIKETATIMMICDDALCGQTSIDSRKFADEFVKRRRAESSGVPWTSEPTNVAPSPKPRDESKGWTAVGGNSKPPAAPSKLSTFANDNKFVVVGKSGKAGKAGKQQKSKK